MDQGSIHLSIIVPAYNAASTLRESLIALRGSMASDTELLVVDDASTDGTAAVAAGIGARLLRLTRNAGPAAARNHGARHARGDILLFVDADVVVAPDVISRVKRAFAEAPSVAAVFGSYDATPGRPGLVSCYRNLLHHYVHQHGRSDAETFWAGLGAVRRSVFIGAGGFDAKRFPRSSIEDIELGYRLRRAGHRIRLDRELQGTHLKGWTLATTIRTDLIGRALPWARLILNTGIAPQDLNLTSGQRLSVLLVGLSGLAAALAPLTPLAAVSVAGLGGVIVLNRRFYAFLLRRRGLSLLAAGIPLHLLYFLCSGAGYAYAWIEWQLGRVTTRLNRRVRAGRTS